MEELPINLSTLSLPLFEFIVYFCTFIPHLSSKQAYFTASKKREVKYMSTNWLKVSAIYLAIGVALGIYMYATGNYEWVAYIHILIFGWLTNAVFGILYSHYRSLAESDSGKAQFWLYNIGLFVFLVGILFISPATSGTWIYIGAISVALSVVLFLVNMFNNLRS